jgi:hypothetical protein
MKSKAAWIAAMGLLCRQSAHAGPADYVYTPTVEKAKKSTSSPAPRTAIHASPSPLGFGYGASDWWFTEVYVKVAKEGGGSFDYDAFEWENKFQLTETGKYPVDVGLITEIRFRASVRGRHRTEGRAAIPDRIRQAAVERQRPVRGSRRRRGTEPGGDGHQWQVSIAGSPRWNTSCRDSAK